MLAFQYCHMCFGGGAAVRTAVTCTWQRHLLGLNMVAAWDCLVLQGSQSAFLWGLTWHIIDRALGKHDHCLARSAARVNCIALVINHKH